MIITIASGKGGTGKTTVATNLLLSLQSAPEVWQGAMSQLVLCDCDVEEPNAALFLNPTITATRPVEMRIPQIDTERCTLCGHCAEVCRYNAMAVVGDKVLVFGDMCHGCGSCTLQCPEGAIEEVAYAVGETQLGQIGDVFFSQGLLKIGSALAPPIIRQAKHDVGVDDPTRLAIIDAPPGTSCPVVQSLRGADFALLVTEPTPFGLHDLRLAVEVARDEMNIPVGVVINRDGLGDDSVDNYCQEYDVPILLRIPLDRRIAEAYSRGELLADAFPEYRETFLALYRRICDEVAQ